MTRVIVDASVLTAALMADGNARHALLHSQEIEFVVPAFIFEEVEENMGRIVSRTGLPTGVIVALIEDIRSMIEVVPRGAYAEALDEAGIVAERAGASGDEDYVALALTSKAPIWSYDLDFARMPTIRRISTGEITEMGAGG